MILDWDGTDGNLSCWGLGTAPGLSVAWKMEIWLLHNRNLSNYGKGRNTNTTAYKFLISTLVVLYNSVPKG